MNKELLKTYWQNPEVIPQTELTELKKLVNDYPYAVGLKQLYCKALLLHNELSFEKELKTTAAQTLNRSSFRKVLLGNQLVKNRFLKNRVQVSNKSDEIIDEKNNEVAVKLKVVGKDEINQETFSDQINENKTEVVDNKEDIIIEKKNKEQTKQEIVETTSDLGDELERQIMIEAVHSSISLEVDPKNNLKTDEGEKSIVVKKTKPSKTSFTTWLDYIENEGALSQEELDFKQKAEQIIDSFLVHQPKIKIKQEFYSPENKAKHSVIENQDIISETLIKIYADQGHYKKAIDGYQKLILKIPEKKLYFAKRIEEINQLQKK